MTGTKTVETATEDEIKSECMERLQILKIDNKIIYDFKVRDKIYAVDLRKNSITDITNLWLLKNIEAQYSLRIYHAIIDEKGMVFLLYISTNNKKDWNKEHKDLKGGFLETYKIDVIHTIVGFEIADGKFTKKV